MATTANYGWTTPDDTDLVKDGASAIRTLGSAIDTTVKANADATGLVHINTTAFNAVASQSLNNIFTSAYSHYRIISEIETTTTAGNALLVRLRASGTDDTTNNYHYGATAGRSNNATYSFGAGSTNTWVGMQLNNNTANHFSFDILYPQAAKNSYYNGGVTGQDATSFYGGCVAGYHNTTTSFDGLSLIVTSGNITGQIRVFGYNG